MLCNEASGKKAELVWGVSLLPRRGEPQAGMANVARGTPIISPSNSPTGPDPRLYAGLVQTADGPQ